MDFSCGSEWRKWDLHVHTPESTLNNQFGSDWDTYIKELFNKALEKNIAAIGLTDYFHIEGYKKVKEVVGDDAKMIELFGDEQIVNQIRNITLFPNIELRLHPIAGGRVNFHVIFSDTVQTKDIEENFLHNLHFVKEGRPFEDTEQKKLKIRNLEDLGRKLKEEHESFQSDSDLFVGMMNAVISDEEVVKELQASPSLFAGQYVLLVSADEDLSDISWDGQEHNTRKKIIQKSNFLLSSNASTIEWGKGNKHETVDNFVKEFKSIKPCIWGSDSHSYETLFEPNLQRYTWIKADPTFAGLKQVINEVERVFIGAEAPKYKNEHEVITSISISNSNGWFAEDLEMPLNEDLVAVIGGRGSGKSALLETIAIGGGVIDEDDENSFLAKAKMHKEPIDQTKITLTWQSQEITEAIVGEECPDEEYVKFLPQKFVEILCSPDRDDELLEQIEDVIFQALDETDQQGAADFQSLLSKLLTRFELQKSEKLKNLRYFNKRVHELKAAIASLPEKKKNLSSKRKQIDLLKKNLPKLSKEDEETQKRLTEFNKLKDVIEAKIIEIKNLQVKIPEVETKIAIFKEGVKQQTKDVNDQLAELGLDTNTRLTVSVDDESLFEALKNLKNKLEERIKTLKGGSEDEVKKILGLDSIQAPNLDSLQKKIEEIHKETKANETLKKKYQLQMKEIEKTQREVEILKKEIDEIDENNKAELKEIYSDRKQEFKAFFKLLLEEKEEIEKLYEPLQESLNSSHSETDKSLQFEAKIIYDLGKHMQDGLDLIDRTKKGRFRSPDSLRTELKQVWRIFSMGAFDEESIQKGIDHLIQKFSTYEDGDEEVEISIDSQLRQNHNLEHFANWVFDINRYRVISSLKFDGTELGLLSPGQKGIVLLILYLHIDKSDTRPLLIDQPEDNLDNLSVYDDLIQYFRGKKQHRQIIIATHNPNLVVNTDSEQIFIANFQGDNNPRISYSSGSLEDCANPTDDSDELTDGIIENVCNILEGGTKAFSGRRKKYQISPKEI